MLAGSFFNLFVGALLSEGILGNRTGKRYA